jgi:DNA polymerase-3 subunit delta
MAAIRAGETDGFVRKPDLRYATYLVYGPDTGLVCECADALGAAIGAGEADPFAHVRIDADLAAAEPNRIVEEAYTVSMFGGERLLRVSGATRRNLLGALKPLLDRPAPECRIIVEAGDLRKDSPLRKAVESAPSALAIPCYPDNEAALDRLIDAETVAAGLSIDADAKSLLRGMLGGDRGASRNEIAKLALYCADAKAVTLADVKAVVGDVSEMAADDLVDAAASGDHARTAMLLDRFEAAGGASDMALLNALRHFQALQLARHKMDAGRETAMAVTNSLRPPLHFSRRDAFAKALAAWNGPAIAHACARLANASQTARARPALAAAEAGRVLLAIALEARRSRAR